MLVGQQSDAASAHQMKQRALSFPAEQNGSLGLVILDSTGWQIQDGTAISLALISALENDDCVLFACRSERALWVLAVPQPQGTEFGIVEEYSEEGKTVWPFFLCMF